MYNDDNDDDDDDDNDMQKEDEKQEASRLFIRLVANIQHLNIQSGPKSGPQTRGHNSVKSESIKNFFHWNIPR